MSALFSPIIGVMLKAVRKSSRGLVRDFNEIRHMQSSYATSEFTRAAYERSGKIIAEELQEHKRGCEIFFEGTREVRDMGNLFWFVSPIDSRTNFMNGLPYFATSVALLKNGEVVAAVVDAPVLRETFYADKDCGVFAESGQSRYVRMHVTKKESLNMALVDFTAGSADVRALIGSLASNHVVLRSMGSVSLGFSYLAASCYDILIYSGLHEYKAGMGRLFVESGRGSVVVKDKIFVAGNFFLCNFIEQKFLCES